MFQTRYCQFKGHDGNTKTYLCTYKDCKLDSKWVCIDCSVQQIHNHGQTNQNHMMIQQQFLELIKQQQQLMQDKKQKDKKLVQICINKSLSLIQSLQFLMQSLQEVLAAIENNYNLEEIEQIIKITNDNYFLLENKQIEKILNINYKNESFQYNLLQDVLQQLIKIDEDLKKLLQNNIKKQNVSIKQEIISANQIIQPNAQLVYQRHFDYTQLSPLYQSQISSDEKYLFGIRDHYMIQVYDILTKQLIKSIQIENHVAICRSTKDFKYLICGDCRGYLYCFDSKNHFIQQYNNQIHSRWINDILPINNNQVITCSEDNSIIVTDIKQKTQQLLIKNAHNNRIQTIDFDQQNDVIISGSNDKSIKFFNKTTGIMEFQKKEAHNSTVYQIQLISDQKQNLLSSGLYNLILWQIDYHNKQLNQIQVVEQEHYNFFSVANNNRIILICKKEVQILGQNLSLVQSINHQFDPFAYEKTIQIDSMNYIIVQSVDRFQIFQKI